MSVVVPSAGEDKVQFKTTTNSFVMGLPVDFTVMLEKYNSSRCDLNADSQP